MAGGLREEDGWYNGMGDFSCFWSSSKLENGDLYWFLNLRNSGAGIGSSFSIEGMDFVSKNYVVKC
ncbi:MAG TPA: hypothetical protein VLA03_03290 [Draconibacterium sp.]|nr:hypothetical protein [Draconibacterium sp.]